MRLLCTCHSPFSTAREFASSQIHDQPMRSNVHKYCHLFSPSSDTFLWNTPKILCLLSFDCYYFFRLINNKNRIRLSCALITFSWLLSRTLSIDCFYHFKLINHNCGIKAPACVNHIPSTASQTKMSSNITMERRWTAAMNSLQVSTCSCFWLAEELRHPLGRLLSWPHLVWEDVAHYLGNSPGLPQCHQ